MRIKIKTLKQEKIKYIYNSPTLLASANSKKSLEETYLQKKKTLLDMKDKHKGLAV